MKFLKCSNFSRGRGLPSPSRRHDSISTVFAILILSSTCLPMTYNAKERDYQLLMKFPVLGRDYARAPGEGAER